MTGLPQFQLKASGAGSVSIDELQILQTPPTLIDASRGNIRYKYAGGDFDTAADTSLWGQEGYLVGNPLTPSSPPMISVSTSLHLNFAGASGGSGQLGIKWTASTTGGPSGLVSPFITPGRQVGVKASVQKASGNFNTLSALVLLGAYGVSTSGVSDYTSAGGQLIASAEFGRLTDGTHYVVGNAQRGYNLFQFATKNDQSGELDIDNVDFLRDQDDPNYGDGSLFP